MLFYKNMQKDDSSNTILAKLFYFYLAQLLLLEIAVSLDPFQLFLNQFSKNSILLMLLNYEACLRLKQRILSSQNWRTLNDKMFTYAYLPNILESIC